MTTFMRMIRGARRAPVSDGERAETYRRIGARLAPSARNRPFEPLKRRARGRSMAARLENFLKFVRRGR